MINYLCCACRKEFTSDEILPIGRCPECLSSWIVVDDEGVTKTHKGELLATSITEAVCKQFSDWMGEPIPFNLKADIYCCVRGAMK